MRERHVEIRYAGRVSLVAVVDAAQLRRTGRRGDHKWLIENQSFFEKQRPAVITEENEGHGEGKEPAMPNDSASIQGR